MRCGRRRHDSARAGIIDVAIHAKGKTLDDCARALAQALGIPIGKEVAVDIEALVAAIGRIDRRVTIMIDALDEAASGQGRVIAIAPDRATRAVGAGAGSGRQPAQR